MSIVYIYYYSIIYIQVDIFHSRESIICTVCETLLSDSRTQRRTEAEKRQTEQRETTQHTDREYAYSI